MASSLSRVSGQSLLSSLIGLAAKWPPLRPCNSRVRLRVRQDLPRFDEHAGTFTSESQHTRPDVTLVKWSNAIALSRVWESVTANCFVNKSSHGRDGDVARERLGAVDGAEPGVGESAGDHRGGRQVRLLGAAVERHWLDGEDLDQGVVA